MHWLKTRAASLNREHTRLPISTVVLAGQRMPVKTALHSVKTADKENVGHPLIEARHKLLPSVTRVFSASQSMYVYLEAYEQYATTMQPLVTFATFYRDGMKVYETQPVIVADGIDRSSRPIALRLTISLRPLLPGRYEVQLNVIEPAGRRAAFWRAPIAIVP